MYMLVVIGTVFGTSMAYDDGLTQATTYRAQQTDQERIHRLEAWIDETSLQLAAMRDEL